MIAVLVLLEITAAAGRQGPSVERYTSFRTAAIKSRDGRPLSTKVSSLFRLRNDIRIVEAGAVVLPLGGGPGQRRISIAFSTSSEDVFLTELVKTATATAVTVFHTDHLMLALRSAATGFSLDDLELKTDDSVGNAFREVLMIWDKAIPAALKQFGLR